MVFRGFWGPNGYWAPFLECMWSLSFLGHGKDGEDLFDNFYSSLLRKVKSYFLNYICHCLPGNSKIVVVFFLSLNYEILLWILYLETSNWFISKNYVFMPQTLILLFLYLCVMMNSDQIVLSLKYLRFTPPDCKDIHIRKFEFVARKHCYLSSFRLKDRMDLYLFT